MKVLYKTISLIILSFGLAYSYYEFNLHNMNTDVFSTIAISLSILTIFMLLNMIIINEILKNDNLRSIKSVFQGDIYGKVFDIILLLLKTILFCILTIITNNNVCMIFGITILLIIASCYYIYDSISVLKRITQLNK